MKILFYTILLFSLLSSYSQISGTIYDELGNPLVGASISVKNLKKGTITNSEGYFYFNNINNVNLIITYVGFKQKDILVRGENNSIYLVSEEALLDIVILSNIDIAHKKTPISTSTIKSKKIKSRLGTQELVEILNTTPSVYTSKQGGGFGDARISLRGFSQQNIAILLNGMPINDMINGGVYWSNWSGISEVTNAIQVQRGVGASKLSVASVGGTINIITDTSKKTRQGIINYKTGNDNYQNLTISYSTGLLKNNLSSSILIGKNTGDGYNDGTEFESYNYFISLGYKLNEKNQLNFTLTGSPQWHNQHSRAATINDYINFNKGGNKPRRKYNPQWGYLNNKLFTASRNYYHKPIFSLNWDFNIDSNSKLTTMFYGAFGRGGGTYLSGGINSISVYDNLFKDNKGQIRFNDINNWNSGNSVTDFGADRTPNSNGNYINEGFNGVTRKMFLNSHSWYGVISTFNKKINNTLNFNLGIDIRKTKGSNYIVINDLLGADLYLDNSNLNQPNTIINKFYNPNPDWNPWIDISKQQKTDFYNENNINHLGSFIQIKNNHEKINYFVHFGLSNQYFQRVDYFNLTDNKKSEWESIFGYNIKGGINYSIKTNHNLFFNTGYYSKQPLYNAIYPNFHNNDISKNLVNEKIFSLELGYKFYNKNEGVNINVYRTSWKDRYLRHQAELPGHYINFKGIEQIHYGIETELFKQFNKIKIAHIMSIGNWEYKKDVLGVEYNEINQQIGASDRLFLLKGKKVGNAAQFTSNFNINYAFNKNLSLDISQRYVGNLYAKIDADDFEIDTNTIYEEKKSLKLPGYSLLDLGFDYTYSLKNKNIISFNANVNNLTNKLYISESATNLKKSTVVSENYKGINKNNRVFFGLGRTWNFSVKYKF